MRSLGHRCLGEELTEYAAGNLSPERRHHWDLHLVTCEHCRTNVSAERRLQQALRLDPVVVPEQLRAALLSLALPAQPVGGVPAVPTAPFAVRQGVRATPLATLSPTAPPVHRSAARSTLLAAMAATAAGAAALGISVGGAAPVVSQAPTSPVRPALQADLTVRQASFVRLPGMGSGATIAADGAQSRP